MRVLVAGIGNIFQGDDAFGCEVAKVLAQKPLPGEVRVVDFGIRGLDLTYALLEAPDLTIMVDAVSRGGEPGTIYTIEPDLEQDGSSAAMDGHTMTPLQVLRAVRSMGGICPRVLLVGCEPADLGDEFGKLGLSATVNRSIEPAVATVESLISRELEI